MSTLKHVAAFLGAAVGCMVSNVASAEEPPCAVVRRDNVVACALQASASAKAERLGLESLEGRRRAAGVVLPSNPSIAVVGATPIEPGLSSRPPLWSATLSQELEIAGQRGARLDVVSAEQKAQRARLDAVRRDVAADALLLYFDAVAAAEETKIADRLGTLATSLATVSKARAQSGVAAGVDATVGVAAAARLEQARLVARQRASIATASLGSALGLDPTSLVPRVEGDLSPISLEDGTGPTLADAAVARRAEIVVAKAEGESQNGRASLYRRLRIPNPTLSVFVRNDWIGEQSMGIGLAFPLPLPSPVGKTYAGEIDEATALAGRAEAEVDRLRRGVRLDVAKAFAVWSMRKQQVDLYKREQVRDSEDALRNIAQEIEAGRLPVKDALYTQQALIDFLFAEVEARRQLCFAAVELARVSGTPLDRLTKSGGSP